MPDEMLDFYIFYWYSVVTDLPWKGKALNIQKSVIVRFVLGELFAAFYLYVGIQAATDGGLTATLISQGLFILVFVYLMLFGTAAWAGIGVGLWFRRRYQFHQMRRLMLARLVQTSAWETTNHLGYLKVTAHPAISTWFDIVLELRDADGDMPISQELTVYESFVLGDSHERGFTLETDGGDITHSHETDRVTPVRYGAGSPVVRTIQKLVLSTSEDLSPKG